MLQKLRRKAERKEAKIAKRVKKMVEKERVVKDTWDNVFKVGMVYEGRV